MSRLPLVDPKTATGRVKELFDGPFKALQVNLFKAMANSPAALEGYGGLHGALSKGVLSLKEREAVQLAIAQANGCEYCQAAHTAIGKMAGMTDAQTVEARHGKPTDPKLAALVRFALALHEKRGNASDSDVQAFRAAGYGDAHITEVIANYAVATFTNFFNVFNRTPVDFPAPPKA